MNNISGNVPEILMIIVALHSKAGTIVLDEPGLSLHPSKRSLLRKYILNAAKNRTIIMITHAPEMLEEDSLKYTYRCFRTPEGSTEAIRMEESELERQSLEPSFKTVLFCENVLFVEGKTDSRFFEIFYWMLDNNEDFQKKLEDLGIKHSNISKWTIIRLEGATKSRRIIEMATQFRINWKLLLDGDMLYSQTDPTKIDSNSLAASIKQVAT